MRYIILIVALAVFMTACTSSGKFDTFAQCISEKNITMYGTEWCPHCKTQKQLFGDSFQYINYVDCDRYQEECLAAGVDGYPTWTSQGLRYSGTQPLPRLAQISGCQLPQ